MNNSWEVDLELRRRDAASLEYEKTRLKEGDTLIVVNLPNGARVYHPQGFVLDNEYRVDSERLLNTGSSFFKSMLDDEKQARQRQLPVFSNRHLPPGIKYVLDLSPSTEDGEEILHLLSCPLSLRQWARTAKRKHVANSIIGGKEEFEFTGTYVHVFKHSKPQLEPQVETVDGIIIKPEEAGEASKTEEKLEDYFSWPEKEESSDEESSDEEVSKKKASDESSSDKRTSEPDATTSKVSSAPIDDTPVDYSLARHCASIERVLQLVSGKEVRLDSGPKVWTVAMVASQFDCANVVVDNILAWLIADHNAAFIELHPEVAYTLGIALKSPLLTRAAFSVLVSEETMGIRPSTAPSQRGLFSPLGRVRDDLTLGEDHLNIIQKAALSFNEQIVKVREYLSNKNMLWFRACNEYKKLQEFRQRIELDQGLNPTSQYLSTLAKIDRVEEVLQIYFRGCILSSQHRDPIGIYDSPEVAYRRTPEWSFQSNLDFRDTYVALNQPQRWCTRQLWELVCQNCTADITKQTFWTGEMRLFAKAYEVRKIPSAEIFGAVNEFNAAVFDFETRNVSLPEFTDAEKQRLEFIRVNDTTMTARYLHILGRYYDAAANGIWPTPEQLLAHEHNVLKQSSESPAESVFFNVYEFSAQAHLQVHDVCKTMLTRPVESETLGLGIAEGITCLNEEQWKFLPLWAGGCDDGTGGVGTDIPVPSEVTWGEMGVNHTFKAASTIGESRLGNGGATESVFSDDRAPSHLGFGKYEIKNLAHRPHFGGGGLAASVSNDDSFSIINGDAAMSEISFPSTFHTSSENEPTPSTTSRDEPLDVAPQMSEGMRALMSDDFMLEDDGDNFEDDDDDVDDVDDFEVMSDDDGEDTETEN